MRQIPSSLSDAILEEPERFIEYLNLNKISTSKNPYQEFMNQFRKSFGSAQGLNLWLYLINRYKLLNELYKSDNLQKDLPDNFKGSLKRKEVKLFFIKYPEISRKTQKRRVIKKPINVKSHVRSGRKIKPYSSSLKHRYTSRQERFILSRKDFPLGQLANEFNDSFGTSITLFGIRDKRLRLLGKKG